MKHLLCFGDSNTWGYVPGSGQRFPLQVRWPGVLQARLGSRWRVIEEGLNGRTTIHQDPERDGRNARLFLGPLLESHAPLDLLILMLGTNDLMPCYASSAADVAAGVGILLDIVATSGAGPSATAPAVLLVAPPRIKAAGMAFELGYDRGSRKVRSHFRALSGSGHGPQLSVSRCRPGGFSQRRGRRASGRRGSWSVGRGHRRAGSKPALGCAPRRNIRAGAGESFRVNSGPSDNTVPLTGTQEQATQEEAPMASSRRRRILGFVVMAAMLTAGFLSAPGGARAAGGGDDSAPTSEYSLAKKALDDGDYDVAINKLARLHEEDPDDADVLNLLGYGYRKSGDFDQARGYYLQALAIDPKHRGANEYIGELYLETGHLDKAEERLGVLDDDCWLGCEEYTDLKEAIAEYKVEKGIQ